MDLFLPSTRLDEEILATPGADAREQVLTTCVFFLIFGFR
jgi:hypothetical protein